MNNGPSEMSGQFFFIQWQHNFVAIASLRAVSIAEISRKWKKSLIPADQTCTSRCRLNEAAQFAPPPLDFTPESGLDPNIIPALLF